MACRLFFKRCDLQWGQLLWRQVFRKSIGRQPFRALAGREADALLGMAQDGGTRSRNKGRIGEVFGNCMETVHADVHQKSSKDFEAICRV